MSIKVYESRKSSDYLSDVSNLLDLNSENGLKATALKVENPRKFAGYNETFTKCIRIDFSGISGSTLTFKRPDASNLEIHDRFSSIFANLDEINSMGIFIKCRFLFSYLYSDFSLALIRAERSKKRATIEKPTFPLSFDIEDELTEHEFISSAAYRNQTQALKNLQILAIKHDLFNNNKPNTLQIRFSLTPIIINSLIINRVSFSENYLYAKKTIRTIFWLTDIR